MIDRADTQAGPPRGAYRRLARRIDNGLNPVLVRELRRLSRGRYTTVILLGMAGIAVGLGAIPWPIAWAAALAGLHDRVCVPYVPVSHPGRMTLPLPADDA